MSNLPPGPRQDELLPPHDFPRQAFNDIGSGAERIRALNETAYQHFLEGWFAVLYRFMAADDFGLELMQSIEAVAPWSMQHPQQHYIQERSLFGLFVSGYAALDSFAYAAYMLRAMRDAVGFPIDAKSLRGIGVKQTQRKFAALFPQAHLTAEWAKLLADKRFMEWDTLRNIVAHRAVPARRTQISFSGPTYVGRIQGEVWRPTGVAGIDINKETAISRLDWLGQILSTLIPALGELF